MKRAVKVIVILIVVLGAAGAAWHFTRTSVPKTFFRTAPVKRGNLVATISATGTVEPEEVIDVGAQVAGQILSFGTDADGKPIDRRSNVAADMVLAKIDDSLYAADLAEADAQVQLAQAGVEGAQANLLQMQAKLDQAANDWTRAQKLGPSEALAQSSYDGYKAAFEVATANVTVARAAITQAKATLVQSEASRKRAQRNLGFCVIKSPVKGIIIDRRVNIGQTVVASLNAPSLFLIAKDLDHMQVWVAVNEADIGSIKPGQPVTFTVDAFPGEEFRGQVGKVWLNASMTQNVVTYVVEIEAENPGSRLLPYLTANVHFELARRENALLMPNAALRWSPQAEQEAAAYRDKPLAEEASGPNAQGNSTGVVWTTEGEFVRPVLVHIGVTDGSTTEVTGDDVKEGMAVVIGEQSQPVADNSGTVNPFAPRLRGRGGANRPAGGARP